MLRNPSFLRGRASANFPTKRRRRASTRRLPTPTASGPRERPLPQLTGLQGMMWIPISNGSIALVVDLAPGVWQLPSIGSDSCSFTVYFVFTSLG